ncbi:NfeD family protein [Aquibacillus albus]|uniref:Membrane-bound ClpP family serine protease n=1 Tax=Aquibacillus albus TaxID=1168171 RepID=A0ABS2MUX1_9BACI|nr:NfeD family protein [Aquibacillus albus]MBM7569650.1 membrane-bound ClpP family serine protease [Aquibacillus albus]
MSSLSADWLSFIVVGLGTLFLLGEILVNMKGFFGLLGLGFITVYFMSYLDPGMFILLMIVYFLGIVLIIIDGKLINDGTLATIGVVCMIISVGLSSPNWVAGTYAVIGIIIGGLCSLFFLKVFKKRDMWTKLTLLDRMTGEQGYNTMNKSYEALLNKTGVTVTDMRPIGTIKIEDKEYSAITNGHWIKSGTPIKVDHVDGTRILISKI